MGAVGARLPDTSAAILFLGTMCSDKGTFFHDLPYYGLGTESPPNLTKGSCVKGVPQIGEPITETGWILSSLTPWMEL